MGTDVSSVVYVLGYAISLAFVASYELVECILSRRPTDPDVVPGYILLAILWPIALVFLSLFFFLFLLASWGMEETEEKRNGPQRRDP